MNSSLLLAVYVNLPKNLSPSSSSTPAETAEILFFVVLLLLTTILVLAEPAQKPRR